MPRIPLSGAESAANDAQNAALGEPLTIREVASLIGVSTWTVRQTLIPLGMPCLQIGANGKLIFFKGQITAWIVQRQQHKGGNRP